MNRVYMKIRKDHDGNELNISFNNTRIEGVKLHKFLGVDILADGKIRRIKKRRRWEYPYSPMKELES